MADNEEVNVDMVESALNDESKTNLNSMMDQYLDEAASHPKYANRKKGGLIDKNNEEFLKNWEKEISKIPAFMNEIPEDLDLESEDNSLIAALQSIKYDEDDPPEEKAKVHKEDGNQWFKRKKYKLAIAAYDEALKEKFNDSDLRAVLYTNRAAANYHRGNMRSSLRDATEAVKHKPKHLKALLRGAECCIKLEEYDKAVVWCDDALKVSADDKRLMELRSAAIKQQKIAERNKRKQKTKDKTADARIQEIVEAIKSRNIQFGQHKENEKVRTQDQLIADAVSTQHQSGGFVTLDESGYLTWPVTFLYPEHGQSDFIQAFSEYSIFQDHLNVLFEEVPVWDSDKLYRSKNLQVFFHHDAATQLVEVNVDSTLGASLQDSRYRVTGEPVFVILPKGTPFTKSYLQRYSSLH